MIVGAKQLRSCSMLYSDTGTQLLRPPTHRRAARDVVYCARCRCNVGHRGRPTGRPYGVDDGIDRIAYHCNASPSSTPWRRGVSHTPSMGCNAPHRTQCIATSSHRGRRCDDAALRPLAPLNPLSASAVPPPSPPPERPRHDCQPLHPGQPGGQNPKHDVARSFLWYAVCCARCLSSGVAAERSNEDVDSVRRLIAPPVFAGDEERSQAAEVLNALLLAMLAACVLCAVVAPLARPTSALRLIIVGLLLLWLLAMLFLMRRGHLRLASGATIAGLWIILIARGRERRRGALPGIRRLYDPGAGGRAAPGHAPCDRGRCRVRRVWPGAGLRRARLARTPPSRPTP